MKCFWRPHLSLKRIYWIPISGLQALALQSMRIPLIYCTWDEAIARETRLEMTDDAICSSYDFVSNN